MKTMSANDGEMVSRRPDEVVSEDAIKAMIMPVRGWQVMLDRDLAVLYGVEVKHLNRQVRRNIERFPPDFMFQLTKEDCLRCQIGTLNGKRGEHLKYMHAVCVYGERRCNAKRSAAITNCYRD